MPVCRAATPRAALREAARGACDSGCRCIPEAKEGGTRGAAGNLTRVVARRAAPATWRRRWRLPAAAAACCLGEIRRARLHYRDCRRLPPRQRLPAATA